MPSPSPPSDSIVKHVSSGYGELQASLLLYHCHLEVVVIDVITIGLGLHASGTLVLDVPVVAMENVSANVVGRFAMTSPLVCIGLRWVHGGMGS